MGQADTPPPREAGEATVNLGLKAEQGLWPGRWRNKGTGMKASGLQTPGWPRPSGAAAGRWAEAGTRKREEVEAQMVLPHLGEPKRVDLGDAELSLGLQSMGCIGTLLEMVCGEKLQGRRAELWGEKIPRSQEGGSPRRGPSAPPGSVLLPGHLQVRAKARPGGFLTVTVTAPRAGLSVPTCAAEEADLCGHAGVPAPDPPQLLPEGAAGRGQGSGFGKIQAARLSGGLRGHGGSEQAWTAIGGDRRWVCSGGRAERRGLPAGPMSAGHHSVTRGRRAQAAWGGPGRPERVEAGARAGLWSL